MSIRRVKVNGRKVWQARLAYRGLRKSAIRESKEAARDAEAALRGELQAQIAQTDAAERRPATLKALLDLYAQDMAARGKGEESVSRVEYTALAVERLCPELLTKPLGELRDADLFAFRTARLREGKGIRPAKPSTINRDLRTLRAALKKARPDYRFPAGAFFREDETRVRWLRPEEELTVLEPMPSPVREIAKLAALTLMRLTEVRLLRWDMVHVEQGVILLPQAKAGARPVVLSAAAQKILQGQREVSAASEWVFPGSHGRPLSREHIGRVFRKATRGAGLKDFHFHDLRHHGATMALNRGFSGPIVMALGGWKTERMMRRYAAVTDHTLRAAAEAVSGAESGNGEWQRPVKPASVLASR